MRLLGCRSLGFIGLIALVAAKEPDDYEGGGDEEYGVYDYAGYAAFWQDRSGLLDEGVAAAEDCVGYDCCLAPCYCCCWKECFGGFGVTRCLSAEGGIID